METLVSAQEAALREVMVHFDVLWRFDYASAPLHAVFDYSTASSDKVYRCCAVIVDQALRLSVQAILVGDFEQTRLQRIDDLNAQWSMGRVYLDRSHGDFDVATGIYLGAGIPGKHMLKELLGHLIDASGSISRMEAPHFSPKLQSSPSCELADIRQVLVSQNLQPMLREDKNILGLRLVFAQELDFVMEFQIEHDQLLRIAVLESNPIGQLEGDLVYQSLQDINRGLSFGTMVFDRGNGRFVYLMSVPLGWFEFNVNLARWLVRRAAAVIGQLRSEGRN